MAVHVNKSNVSKPNANKRTRAQRVADLLMIERLALRGWTTGSIAEEIGRVRDYKISQDMVSRELRKLKSQWQEEMKMELDAHIQKELRGLDRQEEELWAAWDRSQQDAESETRETIQVKVRAKGGGEQSLPAERISRTREGQVGGVQFHNAILEIRKQRRDLLGLDAPKKIASTTPDGKESAPLVICVSADEMPKAKKE